MKFLLCFVLPFVVSIPSYSQYDVQIQDKKISLIKDGKPLVTIDSISINFIAQQFQKIVYRQGDSIRIQLYYPLMPDFNRLETGFDHVLESVFAIIRFILPEMQHGSEITRST